MDYILDISKKADAIPVLAVRKRYRGIRWFTIAEDGVERS
jgi:hypothetical protein